MKYSDKDSPCKIHIIYQDNHLCISYKPSNMVVPIENAPESLEGLLKEQLKKELKKETIFLRPIHRLDKPVEGVVVFARSSKALKRLHEMQRKKVYQKIYIAKVHGKVKKRSAFLTHFLTHDHFCAKLDPDGKEAKLFYRIISQNQDSTTLMIKLHTGRYHQIRAQLSAIGHPIIGDIKYGSSKKLSKNKILLSHAKIAFTHPVTLKKLVFKQLPSFELS